MANIIEVNVKTNSFLVTRLPTKEYYQYDISFKPDITIVNKRERALHLLQTSVAPNLFHPRGVYDGKRLLYLSHKLKLPGGGGAASFTVRLGNDPDAPVGDPGVFQVLISKTASEIIRPADLNALMSVQGQTIDRKAATAMNLLQLLIRQSAHQNNPTNNGRAYFSPTGKKTLPGGIELWRGFFQSVRPNIGRMIVTIDTSMAAVYESGLLHEVAMNVLGARNPRELTLADERDPNFRKLQVHFKNRLIKTRTTGDKTKTIYAIVPGPIGRYTFQKEGSTTTIQDHFRAAYNITLQHPGTFGVRISGRSAPFPVIVPAELCKVIAGQLYKKRLPSSVTSTVVDFATQRPQDRLRTITHGTSAGVQSPIHGYHTSEFLSDAGMEIGMNPITLKAKLLPHPRMEFKGSELTPDNGSWNVVNRRFASPKPLNSWAVVNFDARRINRGTIDKVINGLKSAFDAMGMDVPNPPQVFDGDGHAPAKTLDAIGRATGGNIEMIIVLLPAKADEIRNRVKYWGDVEHGIKTSCLREDKIQRANNQYWNNVAIRLNARLGGHYALPKTVVLAELQSAPFMIFGADVAHPGPGVSRPSIASVVFSWNIPATSYIAYSEVQAPRLEIIENLQAMVKKAILAFTKLSPPPQRIVFYRDGVSEGEMETVKMIEITAIKNACIEVWDEKKVPSRLDSRGNKEYQLPLPKVTFISVAKRHHTIFLPDDDRVDDRKTGNCKAGLAVDKLRSPLALDFYLQSHAAIKGTSRSGHYSILLDEIFNYNVSKFVLFSSSFRADIIHWNIQNSAALV
ncbi:Piwi domain-containing protein [Mycena olivaceomarginata]|nr:Piwi domain-containing protein [Mycena olivaceomarginata]